MPKLAHARALAAAALALSLAACGSGTPPASKATAAAAASQTKSAGKVDVTLDPITVGREVGPSGLVPAAQAGATYVVARYTFKNNGAAPLDFADRPEPHLVDPAGHEFTPEAFSSTAVSAAEDTNWIEPISPNLTSPATSVWKVDEKSFDPKTWKITFSGKHPLAFDLR